MRAIFNKKNLNILFWDDEALTQKELLFMEIKQGFEAHGWIPHIYTDKEAAKEAALDDKIDAVILDLKENDKPVGLDILKYLRERRHFLPIIMFTAYSDIKNIQDAMKEDVSYYLTMPTRSYHEVIRAIEVAVEREKSKEHLVQDQYFASIGKLATGVTHFIKNSLWTISSRAQYLLDKTDKNDEDYKILNTINRRCEDANKVVVNLLNFIKREPRNGEEKEINIVNVITKVLDLVSFEFDHYIISKEMSISCKVALVKGDEFELKEAFLNIIKNAIEAMPNGGKIIVDVNCDSQKVFIKISDTGAGMSKEVLDNLFMPFYTTKDQSAGFGLFDTRRIIHNNNGTIEVDSKIGKGTIVTVTLPKLKGH